MTDDTERVIGVVREQGVDYDTNGEAIPWTDVYVKVKVAFRQKALKLLKGPKLSCFLCVALHVGNDGTAHPSIDTIMRETGYSRSIVCNALADLEKLGFIEKQRRKHDSTLYHIRGYVWFGSDSKPTLLGEIQSSKSELSKPKSRESKRLAGERLPNEPKDNPSPKDQPTTAKDNLGSDSEKSDSLFPEKTKTPASPAPGGADSGKETDDETANLGDSDLGSDSCSDMEHERGLDGEAPHYDNRRDGRGDSGLNHPVADALMMPLARRTAAVRADAGGNWADASEDAADVAEAALSRFCAMQCELPNDNERESMLREMAETIKPLRATVEEIDSAFDIMVKDFGYRVGNYNVFQDSFKRDLATCIRRARGSKRKQPDRYARTIAHAEASQAAFEERMAARGAAVGDDAVGKQVKAELRTQMSAPEYDTFVKLTCFACDDGELVVTAPTEFNKDWLENRLELTIKRALRGFTDAPQEVRFEVQP